MSVEVINTTINAAKTVEERTWRATQFTEDGKAYRCTIHRERRTNIDGLPTTTDRSRIAPDPGTPLGEGKTVEEYANAQEGFEPTVEVTMDEIVAISGETVTIDYGGQDVTVPVGSVPLLLQATYDHVAQRANAKALESAIARAVEKANES